VPDTRSCVVTTHDAGRSEKFYVSYLVPFPRVDGTSGGTVALTDRVRFDEHVLVNRRYRAESASFAGYRFPPEVILLAVRWYLRYGLSYRDVEELLAERGIEVDHVTIYRWVQRLTPMLSDAAQPCRHSVRDRWFVDELFPDAVHDTGQYSNNRIENDHGRLKARLRPLRGLRTDRSASVVIRGHAFGQNLRRGHYELSVETRNKHLRVATAFDELAEAN